MGACVVPTLVARPSARIRRRRLPSRKWHLDATQRCWMLGRATLPGPATFIILNTQFMVFDTKLLVFNTKFIIVTHMGDRRPTYLLLAYNVCKIHHSQHKFIILSTTCIAHMRTCGENRSDQVHEPLASHQLERACNHSNELSDKTQLDQQWNYTANVD